MQMPLGLEVLVSGLSEQEDSKWCPLSESSHYLQIYIPSSTGVQPYHG